MYFLDFLLEAITKFGEKRPTFGLPMVPVIYITADAINNDWAKKNAALTILL